VLQEFTANAVPNLCKQFAETWLSNRSKNTREGRYNCDARAGASACALRNPLRAHCANAANYLQEYTRNAVPHLGKQVAETWLSVNRKLTREGRCNCDARAGALARALRKPLGALCETTANQLQEYTSGAINSFPYHCIHVAKQL